MNKHIKELAEQAGMRTVTYEDDEETYFTESLDVQRFAELIVQECASVCYNSNLKDSDAHAQNLLYEFNIDGARNEK